MKTPPPPIYVRLKNLLSVPGNNHVELYMIVDRGVLHGQLTNQGISFSHVYIRGQFTRMVIDSTNEVGFLYESVSKVSHI